MARYSYKAKCLFYLVILSFSVILSIKFILPYFFTFIFAYWLARYASPVSFCLHHKVHLPRALSNLITIMLILFVAGSVLFLIVNSLLIQVERLVDNLPVYRQNLQTSLNSMCSCCDGWFQFKKGTTMNFVLEYLGDVLSSKNKSLFPGFTRQTLAIMFQTVRILTQLGIMLLSALLILQDHDKLKDMYHNCFLHDDIDQILTNLSRTGLTYMKMQFIIMSIIALLCTAGLFLSHSSYPLLLGILIAIFDALPLFGSGTILVPWAIIKLFSHNITGAAILMSTYLICQITRQFLESRLLGDTLGLAPVYFVMSLFIGIKVYGLTGVILGPFSILLIKTIYSLYKPKVSQN